MLERIVVMHKENTPGLRRAFLLSVINNFSDFVGIVDAEFNLGKNGFPYFIVFSQTEIGAGIHLFKNTDILGFRNLSSCKESRKDFCGPVAGDGGGQNKHMRIQRIIDGVIQCNGVILSDRGALIRGQTGCGLDPLFAGDRELVCGLEITQLQQDPEA